MISGGFVLEARGVTKRFGNVRALTGIDLALSPGEILAVVGDNGAGKSTLLKILSGVLMPDDGELLVGGEPAIFKSAAEAREFGVAAVFQDLAMVECLDVASNLFLGNVPRRGLLVDRRRMNAEATRAMAEMGLPQGPRTRVGLLSAGHRQILAVARAARTHASVFVMDEPTASLGIRERTRVAQEMERLRDAGKALIVVTHDLQLAFDHADRIQVLRLGQVAGVRQRVETTRDEIIGLITGSVGDEAAA